MKIIKYEFYQTTLESGEDITIHKELPWTEVNEETAKEEAYNGEYEIYDDGQPEPEPVNPTPTTDYATYEELAEAFSQGVDSI